MNNNELMHYGILGMKWGKRKASGTSTSGRKRLIKNNWGSADRDGQVPEIKPLFKNNWGSADRDGQVPEIKPLFKYDGRTYATKTGIAASKPKGDRGNWGRDPMSKREQKWIDDNGINPHRPNGTKSGLTVKSVRSNKQTSKGKKVAGDILIGIGGVAVGSIATTATIRAVVKKAMGQIWE